ncbi:MAG: DsbA family protein [Proteobacteria bacterium]|nr:DsbA family protein [Pseudomonadota bacterium]
MLKKNSVSIIGIAVVLLVLATTAVLSSSLAQTASSDKDEQARLEKSKSLLAAPEGLQINVDTAMKDRVIGNEKAPVTIVEYASLTCPHCAHFEREILPELRARLLDTGKAKLIYRDFPLDTPALRAAMMARCVDAGKYFNLIEVIFSNQEHWARSKDPLAALAQLGNLAGMDGDYFKACTNNKELETAILTNMQAAQTKYQIRATPTFIINDGAETLNGALDVDKFEVAVNKLTKGK